MTKQTVAPTELLEKLQQIFPEFKIDPDQYAAIEVSFHSILRDFLIFFGSNKLTFSERKLQQLANIINDAVIVSGDLENAFATCFLEHLGQVKAKNPLAKFLTKESRKRLHP